MNHKSSSPKGLRDWLYPVTKGRRTGEEKACLTARHVNAIPLDASLLKGGPRNHGTHRNRRKGLPTHVPQSWLAPHPGEEPEDGHACPGQGEGDFLIKAGLHIERAQSSSEAQANSHSGAGQASDQYDSTYSYVFPKSTNHRPVSTAEPRRRRSEEEVSSEARSSALPALPAQPRGSLSRRSTEILPESGPPPVGGSCSSEAATQSSRATVQEKSSSSARSFAFPELPHMVHCFASMPLKPLPQLPGEAASSAPGPLEESLLRHQEDSAARSQQSLSEQRSPCSLSQAAAEQLIRDSHSVRRPQRRAQQAATIRAVLRDGSSAETFRARPRISASAFNEPQQGESCASGESRPGRAAPAEKLGPSFEKLVASFGERKAESTRKVLSPRDGDRPTTTYSNPVFATSKLADSLAALQSQSSRGLASAGRCTSEETMASTAATRQGLAPSLSAPTAAHLRQEPQCTGQMAAGKEATCTKHHAQQCGSERGLKGSPGLVLKAQEHRMSAGETSGRSQALQKQAKSIAVAGAAKGVQPDEASRDAPGRQMALRKRSVEGTSAAGLVSPADISAEASDQAIGRQLAVIMLVLSMAVVSLLGCCILLAWRLCSMSGSTTREAVPQEQGTDYMPLSGPWWQI